MEKKQYERLTPTDTIALLNKITKRDSSDDLLKYTLRLKDLEDKIDKGELVEKEMTSSNNTQKSNWLSESWFWLIILIVLFGDWGNKNDDDK